MTYIMLKATYTYSLLRRSARWPHLCVGG